MAHPATRSKVDLEMLSNVHWNLGVSDFLFTDFADALLEAFRTWGSRGAVQLEVRDLNLSIRECAEYKAFSVLKCVGLGDTLTSRTTLDFVCDPMYPCICHDGFIKQPGTAAIPPR